MEVGEGWELGRCCYGGRGEMRRRKEGRKERERKEEKERKDNLDVEEIDAETWVFVV